MRRIAETVVLVICALAACGGGGSGGSGEASGQDAAGSGGEAVVDASVCPPEDQVGQHARQTLGITYAAEVEAKGRLDGPLRVRRQRPPGHDRL